ncbi:MAG: DUF1987 domain-containing protein, partial [Bacteroidales bacterium]|nr:DUF1987 domain-containing protein [Bacteroidales bacterium]MBN2820259.1 DUF1987 domain-containing protein [Bacteroidales bacterium]
LCSNSKVDIPGGTRKCAARLKYFYRTLVFKNDKYFPYLRFQFIYQYYLTLNFRITLKSIECELIRRELVMENLKIESTKNSPEFDFKTNGEFNIHGRIITDNAVDTFKPVIEWIKGFDNEAVHFNIELDYINTTAAMQLFALLKLLDENLNIKEIIVQWFYESDDEDHLETGQLFESKLERVKFRFISIRGHVAA